MPYLFQRPWAVQVPITFHDTSQDLVQLPGDLWDTLLLYGQPHNGRLPVMLSRKTMASVHPKDDTGLTCWCIHSDVPTLAVPRAWAVQYPHLFSIEDAQLRDTHSLAIAYPICLRTVVLQSVSPGRAREDGAHLVDWLSTSRTILCAGSIVFAPLPSTAAEGDLTTSPFKVKMAEPATSGYVDRHYTRVVLVQENTQQKTHINGIPSTPHDDDDDSVYDIDERFLGNMVDSRVNSGAEHVKFKLLATPRQRSQQDTSIYVRTGDLSSIGVLDGDWAVINSVDNTRRLVRVYADDSLNSGAIHASPVTIFNLSKDGSRREHQEITLHSTPFGSRRPAIPTARTVTIARIASPMSTNRIFQPYFLQSLQHYFQGQLRLVKQGDIIAIPLDTDEYRRTWSEDKADAPNVRVGLDYSDPSASANEIVNFMVTNIEHDVVVTDPSNTDDVLAGCIMGEYGCWVDAAVTRMVQAGIEHSRVPDVTSYLGLIKCARQAMSSGYEKLLAFTSAALTRNAVEFELQVNIILKGARGTGKMTAASQVARKLGLHLLEVNCYSLIGENDAQTEGTLRARFEKAASCSPCLLLVRHVDALGQTTQGPEAGKANALAGTISACIEELQRAWRTSGFPVIVVATTDSPDQTAPGLLTCFKHEIMFEAPDDKERSAVLRTLLDGVQVAPDVSIVDLAMQTAALVASDLVDLVSRGEQAHASKAAVARDNTEDLSLVHAGSLLTASDLEMALNNARTSYSESIGAPKIPTVSWDDVGGLANVKKDILDTVQLPLENPELFSAGLKKRSGILLYGPPGTGKTLLAKAVATSCNLNFFSVKGPELLNMYIGESEANVRRVFQRARDAKPCVIFFDELDSVAPKRGNHGDSGGVMDRIVSQLLAELDGVSAGESGGDVFVIGATNRPDLLDSALLRPGRFDRMIYLGVSQTHEAQLHILQALTRKFKLHPDLDLRRVADSCPFHYTGADFYALCSDSLLKAMSRKAEEVETKIAKLNAGPVDSTHPYPLTPQYYLAEMACPDDIDVLVHQTDFDAALHDLIPSVSQAEMDHYARVQQQFSQETINSVEGKEE
ncbi:P-loop containing nucleoside triphosphate hydrolase protein [Cytidiella melzeri]|nr:P-loop containing nucleoside triphosphate hydrolase protein [Cytidiella melzeri]